LRGHGKAPVNAGPSAWGPDGGSAPYDPAAGRITSKRGHGRSAALKLGRPTFLLKKTSQQNFVVKTLIRLATRFECGVPAADFALQHKFRVLKAASAR
jgi:hypothetical protein